jgi:hypothetical protein
MLVKSRRKFLLHAASLIAAPAIIRPAAAKAWSHGGDLAWDHGALLPTVNLVFIGDSTFTSHSNSVSFPSQLTSLLASVGIITATDLGVNGQTVVQQLALVNSAGGSGPLFNPGAHRNIVVLHCGSNDASGVGFSTWQTDAQALVNAMVSQGYRVVVTEAYQWLFGAFPGFLFNTSSDWAEYNTIVDGLTGTFALINTSSITQINTQANVSNLPYYVDTEHLTTAGNALWAALAKPIVAGAI